MPWFDSQNSKPFPAGETFSLRGVRLPACTVGAAGLPAAGDGLVAADLAVSGGRIDWIGAPGGRGDLAPGPDLAGALVWPRPLDCHTHLDKGQVWARSPNPDGSFAGAGQAAAADAERYQDSDDIAARAGFQLAAAHAHGTAALRSHVDGNPAVFDRAFEVLGGLAETWRDRLTLQLCPFTGPEEPAEWVEHLAAKAATRRPGILSGFLYTTPGLEDFLGRMIALAERFGLALDFHADENLDPESHCLRAVAAAVLRTGFQGPVLVGHCCALAVQPRAEMDRTLDLAAEAGVGVVSLPLTNAYLMDRRGAESPRHRGHAPVAEMRRRGIPVALASDNVRDGYYAYGDLDLPELFRDAVRIMQLDHPVGDWVSAVTTVPADLMGLPGLGRIAAGGAADLVIFRARNWSEFVSRPLSRRVILSGGRPLDTAPPDYEDLDDLKGMEP